MEFKYELDPVAAKLVQDGVITINVVFTRTGVDAWARSVQAHPRLEVFPHHSLTLGELSNVFSKHQSLSQFSTKAIPEATSSHAVVPSRKAILENTKFKPAHRSDSDDGMETMSVDAAQMRINTYGLNRINKGGVINSLPVDSLTSFDLKWHDKLDLFSRMLAVADKLGNNVILGRITTQKELNIPGVRDLKSWWDSADYQKRLRVLSNQKKLNVTTLQYREHPLLRAVEVLPCPFRGIAENLVVESDDDFKIFSDDTEN